MAVDRTIRKGSLAGARNLIGSPSRWLHELSRAPVQANTGVLGAILRKEDPLGRKSPEEMAEAKRRAMSLIKANPTLSMTRVGEHVGVSQGTVSKWFKEAHLKRWFC